MQSVSQFLIEKTFRISHDVDFVYKQSGIDKIAKIFRDALKSNDLFFVIPPELKPYVNTIKHGGDHSIYSVMTTDLKSKEIQEADDIRQAKIQIGFFREGSYYMARKNLIRISLNKSACKFVLEGGKLSWLSKDQQRTILNEFEPSRIKATIAHEISHWLNDVLHNSNIRRLVKKSYEKQDASIMYKGNYDIYQTDYEIDALIHGIKEIKKAYRKEWDSLTWYELMNLYPSLDNIKNNLLKHSKKELDKWYRLMFTRMAREKLIGKNMRP